MKVLEQKTKQKCDFTEEWELLTIKEQRKFKREFKKASGLTSDVAIYGLLFGRLWMSVERSYQMAVLIEQIKTVN